jgi:Predicted hydrolases or acyltransferases (alpha/beta hydrolase superfamily)
MQEMYVDDIGEGFPLVLVHGFLGSSAMWDPQKKYLSKYFRIITPALPGFGESSKLKSLDSINAMATKILELLEKKEINKFNLMGHSMGGMIVQEMTKLSGNKINKLICYATGPVGDIPGRFETIDISREKLKKEGIEKTANRISKKWFVEGDKAKNFYLCDNANKLTTEEAADNALKALKNWKGIDNLKNINNETLIIWGDKDTAYNYDQVDTLNKNIKNSKLEIFEGCSHNVHLELSEKFNEIVKNF